MKIPDLRDKAERPRYDTACTDPCAAKNMLQPSDSKGNPFIPNAVYDKIKARWQP